MEKSKDCASLRTKSDEMGLIDLLFIAWKAKWIIAIFVALGGAFSGYSTFSSIPTWTSKAVVTSAAFNDREQLSEIIKSYQSAFETAQHGNIKIDISKSLDPYQTNPIARYEDSSLLFEIFLSNFNSSENKSNFLKERGTSANFESHPVGKNLPAKNYILTIKTKDKDSAPHLLNEYIETINKESVNLVKRELSSIIKVRRTELLTLLESQENFAKLKRQHMIKKLELEYNIAKRAKIERPLDISNTTDFFNVGQGYEIINSKISAFNDVKDLSIIDPRIIKIKSKLTTLERKVPQISDEVNVYSYIDRPINPSMKIKDRGPIKVVVGMFLGLIFGLFFSFIGFVILDAKEKHKLLKK
ncbi:Wzz/FepE/Etk N-terminal domain-containing protein [Enterovibrio norvegicus]|uniref:Wzz/FepE/Etk N-terminal domain-containing protein n=1 Tax=Enterovibrio norvegicus TaxID=188144 RepID=UPI003899F444